MIDDIQQLPDISFIDNLTLEDVQRKMINDYQAKYEELTGKKSNLHRADPMNIILRAASVQLYQALLYVDRQGKMSLLKYSFGSFLDHLGAIKGVKRRSAAPAYVQMKFTLSEERPNAVSIPAGTRVTGGQEIYFSTTEYSEIPVGSKEIILLCECLTAGENGNGFQPGEIDILSDPIGYVAMVENVDVSAGGTSTEDDDSLIDRIYNSPSSYSVAGPDDAYVYWTKTYNPNIGDVRVSNPKPVEVVITFLMKDGSVPQDAVIKGLEDFLMDENIRPLTDKVTVQKPSSVSYDLNVRYFINRSSVSQAESIQGEVGKAVDDYIIWQRSKIGRDINPSELTRRILNAGAKRVEITSPDFQTVTEFDVALVGEKTVVYGGVEDD